MKQREWIAKVSADMYCDWDAWHPTSSSIMLSTRWWRMMHPLVWDTDWASEGMICFPPELAGMTFDEAVAASQDIPEDLF